MRVFDNIIDPIDLKEVKKTNIIVPNSINALTTFYYDLQRIIKADCFFEIGAFEANFSREMKRVYSSSDVWAFEANPYNYDFYKKINSNINYLNLAVSNVNGIIDFYLQDKNLNDGLEIEKVRGNNSILNRNDDTILYQKVQVESVTLDSFIENKFLNDKLFSLWIDVEGANKNILTGFEKYIENSLSILIEVEEYEYWENQWLCENVYEFLDEKNFIPIVRDFEDNDQYNVVFINASILKNDTIKNKIKDWMNNYFSYLGLDVSN
jgi:FkbM family methyltransferase